MVNLNHFNVVAYPNGDTEPLWSRELVVSPSGLAVRVVWFHDIFSDDGPVMFRTDLEADIYILLMLKCLSDEWFVFSEVEEHQG